MQTFRNRGLLVIGCLFALFLATGCFQAAGDTLQATGIAQGIATFTPEPSVTPPPSPSLTPADLVEETAETETAESAASVLGQVTPEAAAQDLDPRNLTSTAIIERATIAAAAEMTATAEAELGQFVPTATPTLFTLETPTPQPQQPILGGADCIHEVQVGDQNLWRISRLYGVTVHDIQASTAGLNDIQLIHVGDRLVIPGCGTTGYFPPPTSIPSDGSLGQGGGGTGGSVGGCTPAGGSRVHVVRQNETLYRIALQYGASVNQLIALNCITNSGLIYIDQRLAIP